MSWKKKKTTSKVSLLKGDSLAEYSMLQVLLQHLSDQECTAASSGKYNNKNIALVKEEGFAVRNIYTLSLIHKRASFSNQQCTDIEYGDDSLGVLHGRPIVKKT